MIRTIIICIGLIVFSTSVMAQEEGMQFGLAQDRVDISTGFNGTSIAAFGTYNSYDGGMLVVTLKGPETKVIVRKKERGMTGVWSNDENVEFRRVLNYYDYVTNFTDDKSLESQDILNDAQIGVENLGFYPENEMTEEKMEPFRDALIRNMQSKGLYPVRPKELVFYGQNLFKASFLLPPGVPTGTYTIDAVLIKNGRIEQKASRTLQVGQVGFNAKVYVFANEHAFLYGVFSVLLALVFGWSAFTFLRRD